MSTFEDRLQELILKLHEIDALKFGNFMMKVGMNSPVYFDLRVIVSYPKVMNTLSHLLWEFAQPSAECQHICGVPYTALPIASLISVQADIPMLIRRKETKSYGTKKLIEGKFNKGDKCIIIEDVVTSGSSILDTFKDLEKEGLVVTETIVVVDRQQGGVQNLKTHGLQMRSLCTLSKIMKILCQAGRVDEATVKKVADYIASSQVTLTNYLSTSPSSIAAKGSRLTMNFLDRASEAKNPVSARLLRILSEKHTNLCVSADVTTADEVLKLAATVGPYICLLKIHVDIIQDFNLEFTKKLRNIADEHSFLIMEDRKFADIGHIVGMQYSQGLYNIASWADLVTVHPVTGEGVLNGLKKAAHDLQRGCFLVVEMSTEGNLNSPEYVTAAMKLTESHPEFVSGVVCQSSSVVTAPGLIQLTPGVQLGGASGDGLGQQYNSPEHVVLGLGADVAVVGRGITGATDTVKAAKDYRDRLWAAYEKRIAK